MSKKPLMSSLTPLVPTGGDVPGAIAFYTEKLGFEVFYQDPTSAIIGRGNVRLFLTDYSDRHVAEQTAYRISVDDVDSLYAEFKAKGMPDFAESDGSLGAIADRPWGAREFAIKDLAGVCITFYQDLDS